MNQLTKLPNIGKALVLKLNAIDITSFEELKAIGSKQAIIKISTLKNSGACIKYKTKQIAVFNFTRTSKWYASQNLCPHKMEMVLSIGMIGNKEDVPKVSCPLHKKNFSLEDGSNLAGEDYKIAVYPVKIENENVYIGFND
jgi:nitrite reductase (NADH) small subunit